jgi:hypothetical protein
MPGAKTEARALAMVLLESAPTLTSASLASVWRSAWPDVPGPTDFDSDEPQQGPGAMTLRLDGMTGALGVMPAPIPGGELDGPAATSWLWPNATEQIPRVGAHVVAWVSGPGLPVDAHQHLTRLVTAVSRATDALGVYCGAAGQVVRADVFDGLAHDYHPDRLPVMLWIDFRAFQDQGRSSLFTVGMSEFGLMELEIPRSDKPPGQLREFAMNLAAYLISEGPVIGDGHTVGGDEAQRVVVRHTPSMTGRASTVYTLEGL